MNPLNGAFSVYKTLSLYTDSNYAIVIGYPQANAVLWKELDLITHELESTKSGVGIWVLSEQEGKRLCERNLAA